MMKMTPKKAIEILENERECVATNCDRDCGKCPLVKEEKDILDAFDLAIKSLKRDVPIRPERMITPRQTKFFEFHDWRCPVCKWFLAFETEGKNRMLAHEKSRCINCYQMIDWSDEDDSTGSD